MGYIAPKDIKLRASSFDEPTSLQMALARTRDLIEYIRRTPDNQVDLGIFIDNSARQSCSVADCGTPACIAGHAIVRYAPVSVHLDQESVRAFKLRDHSSQMRPLDPVAIAAQLLRPRNAYGLFQNPGGYQSLHRGIALKRLREHREWLKKEIKEGKQ